MLEREFDGKLFPVAFAGKKLLPRESFFCERAWKNLAIVLGFTIYKHICIAMNLCCKLTINPRHSYAMGCVPSELPIPDSAGEGEMAADYLSHLY